MDPSFVKTERVVAIYQAYYRFSDMGKLEDGHWYVFLEPQIGETISCVHRKDKFLTLGLGGFKGRSLKKSMEVFKNFLAENFRVTLKDMERDEGCLMRMAPPFLGQDNIILAGEAAGMIYLNGEGISAAIDSGYRAGKAVAQAIKSGDKLQPIYKNDIEDIIRHVQLCKEKTHFFVQ